MFSEEEEVEKVPESTFIRPGDEIISIREICLDDKFDKKFLEFNSTNDLLPNLNKNDLEISVFRDVFPEDLEAQQASFQWTEEDGNIADLVSEPGFGTTGQTSFGKDLDAVLADTDLKAAGSSKKKRGKRDRIALGSSNGKQHHQIKTLLHKGNPNISKVDKNDPRSRFHYVKYLKRLGRTLKIWECGICSREFQHQYTLMRHLPTHTDERKYTCNFCGKSFRQLSTLSQHKAIHSSERPFSCEMCSKTFNRVSTLISHRKTHTDNKPYKCHLCPKGFHQKGNLRNHLFTHTNERPYRCNICNKGFNQQSNLVCHKNKSHPEHCTPEELAALIETPKIKSISNPTHQSNKCYDWSITPEASWYPPVTRETWTPSEIAEDLDNGVIVDKIKTYHMQVALATKQTPFALLKPENSSPVVVKVLDTLFPSAKQILVAATAEDLLLGGKIVVKNGEESQIRVPIVGVVEARMHHGNLQLEVNEPPSHYHTALALNGEVAVEPCKLPSRDDMKENTPHEQSKPKSQKQTKVIKLPSLKKFEMADVTNGDSSRPPSSPPLVLPLDMTSLDLFQSVETMPDGVLDSCSLQDDQFQSASKSLTEDLQPSSQILTKSGRKPLKVIKLPCLKKLNDAELAGTSGEPSTSLYIPNKDSLLDTDVPETHHTIPEHPRSQRKPLKVIKLPSLQQITELEIVDTTSNCNSSSSPLVSSLSTLDITTIDMFSTNDSVTSDPGTSSTSGTFSGGSLNFVGTDLFNENNVIDLSHDFDQEDLPIKIENCFI